MMCGISTEVNDVFGVLEELNHTSSLALRLWVKEPLVKRKQLVRSEWTKLNDEMKWRHLLPGGAREFAKFWPGNLELWDQHRQKEQEMDELVYRMKEGKLSSGTELKRPYRGLPMFVGVLATGFDGAWMRESKCIVWC